MFQELCTDNFNTAKFSKLQLVVHTTTGEVLDTREEDACFRQSTSSKKKKERKKIHR